MCGIAGIWASSSPIDASNFDRMIDSLASRGPDGRGVKSLDEGRLFLGHRRLSIIDLSDAGSQPMMNEDGTVWLTFNGEIYNYVALRDELKGRGHVFASRSDSETIIHAYEEWGHDCVRRFRGIFAFAIFDTRQRSLFLARDHVGVKPLYYHCGTERFIFGSQPRAILEAEGFAKKIDPQAFSLYLAYGNTPAATCIYDGIEKLKPGHWLVLKDGRASVNQYWRLQYKPVIHDYSEAIEAVRAKVEDAVRVQSVSDVPVGTLLSGGVDSTIVTALESRSKNDISSFTIGFNEEESDERQYARFAANSLGTQHHEQVLTYNDAIRLLPEIIEAYDEPFHLNGLFPFYALARLVQSSGVKVAIGGDGADEVFAGYLWYERFHDAIRAQRKKSIPYSILRAIRLMKSVNQSPIEAFFRYNGFFDETAQRALLNKSWQENYRSDIYASLLSHWEPEQPPVLAAQLLDFNCFLVDHCLTKVDRSSMACGVEVRVPFLDIELVELVFSIDHNVVFRNHERKSLLKTALRGTLPAGMDAGRKKGFSSPLGPWLENGLSLAGKNLLFNGSLCASGILEENNLPVHYHSMSPREQLLLIGAELWHRFWIDNDVNSVRDFCANIEGFSDRYVAQ